MKMGQWIKDWKRISFLLIFLAGYGISGFSQTVNGVGVRPKRNQSVQQQRADEQSCYNTAINQGTYIPKKHKTLKRGAEGAGIGAVGGAILGGGKGAGTGAVIGGATGAILGHRSTKKAERRATETGFNNEAYASCLRSRGYKID